MKGTAILSAFLSLAPLAATAAPPVVDAWRLVDASQAIIEDMGRQIDADRDGLISEVELKAAAREMFMSVDVDCDGNLTREEVASWRNDFVDIAIFRGRKQAYDATMSMVFDLLDKDKSGDLDVEEHAAGMDVARTLADRDGDGSMSLAEFREGFLFSMAFRHALTG